MALTKSDPRRIAWDILRSVESGAYSDVELARRLRNADLDHRDRRLTTHLVYGTLCWQGLSDYILGQLGRPAGKMEEAIRTLLRLAIFQLTKLDRVPDFAIVNTAVELAKLHKKGAACGLVNALLRRFLRQRESITLPSENNLLRHLATKHSHPTWIVGTWLNTFGRDETERLLTANNHIAPTVLRVNHQLGSRQEVLESLREDGLTPQPTPFSPDGIVIRLEGPIESLRQYQQGLVTPQGEASQIVSYLIPRGTKQILDACAAPGGKSTHLAERGSQSSIVAIDRNLFALRRVRKTTDQNRHHISPICTDARILPFAANKRFDAILVDAPCSGLGTLRQHPEIRWNKDRNKIKQLVKMQAAILNEVEKHVAPGGHLIYATCTINTVENEDQISKFLDSHRDFKLDDPCNDVPPQARVLIGQDKMLHTFPHRHNTDGFYAARLKKE